MIVSEAIEEAIHWKVDPGFCALVGLSVRLLNLDSFSHGHGVFFHF